MRRNESVLRCSPTDEQVIWRESLACQLFVFVHWDAERVGSSLRWLVLPEDYHHLFPGG
ncbi:hypothetical protein RBWH47_03769 [Rhodopirellula baltica WH47]|uniref:Uncharacterized protein n=1 Tax=Rhodopirellula baltica WH47 TaxID=991778 RepID=F2ANJ1_RHOBT|nr:hypothetical protein RBWH47_03769 [Rhodopirellula baltica WH47]